MQFEDLLNNNVVFKFYGSNYYSMYSTPSNISWILHLNMKKCNRNTCRAVGLTKD